MHHIQMGIDRSPKDWNRIWEELLQSRSYRTRVRICRTQEEVDQARRSNLPLLGVEKDHVRLTDCPLIWQPEGSDFVDGRLPSSEQKQNKKEEESSWDGQLLVPPDDLLLLAYCRQSGIPMRMAESPRLILRELCPEDLSPLFKMYSEPGMTTFIDPLPSFEEAEKELSVYISQVYGIYGYGLWAVTDRQTGALIGRAGIESKPGLSGDTVELGYQIAPHLFHRGYGREAVHSVLSFVRDHVNKDLLDLKHVIARVRPGNLASIKILEGEGFLYSHTESCQALVFELNLMDTNQ